jgi:hypothetical protein
MDSFELFKMIFYALDNQYDENPNEELGDLLSSMNPFLFNGIGSAVPDIYIDFKKVFEQKFDKCTIEEGYYFADDYLKLLKNESAIKAFQNVTFEDWKAACDK